MKAPGITKNVCGTDRKMSIYGGLALLGVGFCQTKKERNIAGKVIMGEGADILLSAITRFCPINKTLGINTCRTKV